MKHALRLVGALSIFAAIAVAGASWLLVNTAHAGGGCHRGDARDERGTAVSMEGNCFTPSVLRVDAGQTVTFTNNDLVESKGDSSVLVGVEHYVAGANRQWGDHETVPGGESVSYSFADEGTFLYFCALHPGMVGAIVVGDGTPDGASIGDAPAGRTDSVAAAGVADAAPDAGASASKAAPDDDGDGLSLGIIGLASGAAVALVAGAGAAAWVRARRVAAARAR